MDINILLFELVEKSVIMTADILHHSRQGELEEVNNLVAKRESLLQVLNDVYVKAEKDLSLEFKDQLNQLIDQINLMNDQIVENLLVEKEKTQIDIAKSFKNKENFKGYNLNSTK